MCRSTAACREHSICLDSGLAWSQHRSPLVPKQGGSLQLNFFTTHLCSDPSLIFSAPFLSWDLTRPEHVVCLCHGKWSVLHRQKNTVSPPPPGPGAWFLGLILERTCIAIIVPAPRPYTPYKRPLFLYEYDATGMLESGDFRSLPVRHEHHDICRHQSVSVRLRPNGMGRTRAT